MRTLAPAIHPAIRWYRHGSSKPPLNSALQRTLRLLCMAEYSAMRGCQAWRRALNPGLFKRRSFDLGEHGMTDAADTARCDDPTSARGRDRLAACQRGRADGN